MESADCFGDPDELVNLGASTNGFGGSSASRFGSKATNGCVCAASLLEGGVRGSSGWDKPQRQTTDVSPVGHKAFSTSSPTGQDEHFEPPAIIPVAAPGLDAAQFSVVSPGRD